MEDIMKKISVIGIGKLGLCFALTLERSGYSILGLDISPEYVSSVNNKTLKSDEHGVEEYLKDSKNFNATLSLESTVDFSNYLYVVVATPSLNDGRYDHSQVDNLVQSLVAFGKQKETKNLVICCTTMPGYCDTVSDRLNDLNYTVSYNPEFIAQGTILRDQSKPDMVLIGEDSLTVGNEIQKVYEDITLNKPRICRMSRKEAEICKISLNCFLTTKIAFANMIGDIALNSNCRPGVILSAIGSDSRVGNKYLGYGYGYGGPCFPRDNRALSIYSNDIGIEATISIASDKSNEKHLRNQLEYYISNNNKETEIIFDYVTYKPQSTMLVESQQLKFAVSLAKEGYRVVLNERKSVIKELKTIYGDLFVYKERQ
jgi:nucleotide sugar dehydrogenase